jgi:hypothetical protein
MRSGIDPIQGVRQLKDRLITLHMHDLHAHGAGGHDVPWGTGVGNSQALLKELHQLGIRPTMFGIEYAYNWLESMPDVAKCISFFNQASLMRPTACSPAPAASRGKPRSLPCWRSNSATPSQPRNAAEKASNQTPAF